MSHPYDGEVLFFGSDTVVEQLQLHNEKLSSKNVCLQTSLDVLLREKEEWLRKKADMTACLEQSVQRLTSARALKKQAMEAHSATLDELRRSQENITFLKTAAKSQEKTLRHTNDDLHAAIRILDDHFHQCPQDVREEQFQRELAQEAYITNDCDGRADFVIPVRIIIRSADSQAVSESKKWKAVRTNAKKIMHVWYKEMIRDGSAYLAKSHKGQRDDDSYFEYDMEDVVLQRRRGV